MLPEAETHIGTQGAKVLDDVARYSTNSRKQTHGVCSKRQNGYGLCDMSGNVYEWVWDWKDDYERFSTRINRDQTLGLRAFCEVAAGTMTLNMFECRIAMLGIRWIKIAFWDFVFVDFLLLRVTETVSRSHFFD